MTTVLLWAWLAFLAFNFFSVLVVNATEKQEISDLRRFCRVFAAAWIGLSITAILVFLASKSQ